MGKKKADEMAKLEIEFVVGGVKNGYNDKDLSTLFHQIEGFSGYGLLKNDLLGKLLTCKYLEVIYDRSK